MNFPFTRRHMHRLYEYCSEDVQRQINLYLDTTLAEGKEWINSYILKDLTPDNGEKQLERLIKFFGLTHWEGHTPCAIVSNPGEVPLSVQLVFMNECMCSKVAQNSDETLSKLAGEVINEVVVKHPDSLWKEILFCNTMLTLVDEEDRRRWRQEGNQAAGADSGRCERMTGLEEDIVMSE